MNIDQEEILFNSRDEFSEISITEHAMIRNLYFGNDKKQSSVFVPEPSVLILPYSQAMTLSMLFKPEPARVLLIGLGGGSLAQFLLKAYPGCEIDVVELRSHVIELCHEYFLLPKGLHHLHIHHNNAKDFVENQLKEREKKYDIIFLDAFDQHGPADINNNTQFLYNCKHLLSKNGVLCTNLWNRREDVYHQWYRNFCKQFDDNCLELRLGKINSNVVVFGFAEACGARTFHKLNHRAEEYKIQLGVDFPKYLKMIHSQNNFFIKRIKRLFSFCA